MSFTEAEQTYLAEQRIGRIATASMSGVPDVAPVTFRLTSDGRFEIDGLDNPKTLKWRNIMAIRITPEVIWSWGINADAAKHFGGVIERRTVEPKPS